MKTKVFIAVLLCTWVPAAMTPVAWGYDTKTIRDDSTFQFTVYPGNAEQGVSWGFYAGNWMMGMDFGNLNTQDQLLNGNIYAETQTSQLTLRYFMGNSFNLIFGYGWRDIQGNLWMNGQFSYGQLNTTEMTFGFSNQWIMDFGLILGVDWLVWTLPETHKFQGGGGGGTNQQWIDTLSTMGMAQAHTYLFKLSMGMAF